VSQLPTKERGRLNCMRFRGRVVAVDRLHKGLRCNSALSLAFRLLLLLRGCLVLGS
jgi:hypothetical protein